MRRMDVEDEIRSQKAGLKTEELIYTDKRTKSLVT